MLRYLSYLCALELSIKEAKVTKMDIAQWNNKKTIILIMCWSFLFTEKSSVYQDIYILLNFIEFFIKTWQIVENIFRLKLYIGIYGDKRLERYKFHAIMLEKIVHT